MGGIPGYLTHGMCLRVKFAVLGATGLNLVFAIVAPESSGASMNGSEVLLY